jgi:hypothetical protein
LCREAVCCTARKPTWRRCCEVYLRAPMSRGVAPFASAPTAAAWHERAASGAGIRNRAGGDSKSKGTSQRPDKSATRSGTSMGPGEHSVCGTFRKFPRGHARGMAAAVRDSTGASAKKSSGNFRTSQVPTQMWPWGRILHRKILRLRSPCGPAGAWHICAGTWPTCCAPIDCVRPSGPDGPLRR